MSRNKKNQYLPQKENRRNIGTIEEILFKILPPNKKLKKD